MLFSPLFLPIGSNGETTLEKPSRLGKTSYLFSDIIKVHFENEPAEIESAGMNKSIKSENPDQPALTLTFDLKNSDSDAIHNSELSNNIADNSKPDFTLNSLIDLVNQLSYSFPKDSETNTDGNSESKYLTGFELKEIIKKIAYLSGTINYQQYLNTNTDLSDDQKLKSIEKIIDNLTANDKAEISIVKGSSELKILLQKRKIEHPQVSPEFVLFDQSIMAKLQGDKSLNDTSEAGSDLFVKNSLPGILNENKIGKSFAHVKPFEDTGVIRELVKTEIGDSVENNSDVKTETENAVTFPDNYELKNQPDTKFTENLFKTALKPDEKLFEVNVSVLKNIVKGNERGAKDNASRLFADLNVKTEIRNISETIPSESERKVSSDDTRISSRNNFENIFGSGNTFFDDTFSATEQKDVTDYGIKNFLKYQTGKDSNNKIYEGILRELQFTENPDTNLKILNKTNLEQTEINKSESVSAKINISNSSFEQTTDNQNIAASESFENKVLKASNVSESTVYNHLEKELELTEQLKNPDKTELKQMTGDQSGIKTNPDEADTSIKINTQTTASETNVDKNIEKEITDNNQRNIKSEVKQDAKTEVSDKKNDVKTNQNLTNDKPNTLQKEVVQNSPAIEKIKPETSQTLTNKLNQNSAGQKSTNTLILEKDTTVNSVIPDKNTVEKSGSKLPTENKETQKDSSINGTKTISADKTEFKNESSTGHNFSDNRNENKNDERAHKIETENVNHINTKENTLSELKQDTVNKSVQNFKENVRVVNSSQLIKHISDLTNDKSSKDVVLKLSPENMGKVKISLNVSDNQVHINIEVENETIKTLIHSNTSELKQNLVQNGLQLNSLNISLSNSEDKPGKSFNQKKKLNLENNAKKIDFNETETVTRKMGYNTYEYLA